MGNFANAMADANDGWCFLFDLLNWKLKVTIKVSDNNLSDMPTTIGFGGIKRYYLVFGGGGCASSALQRGKKDYSNILPWLLYYDRGDNIIY